MNVRKSSNNLSYAPTDVRASRYFQIVFSSGTWPNIHVLYPQKSAETGAVHYLIFYLMVTQAIVTLEKQYLEHQHTIYGRTPGIALTLAVNERLPMSDGISQSPPMTTVSLVGCLSR